jgi:predicted dehydrogenase
VIRVGIVGSGFGAAVHLPAFQSLPGARVVAVASRRPEKAAEIARRHGLELGGTIDDLFAVPLDAVSIALPPGLTAEVAARALDAGLAVLAEKPLADTAARADKLADRARGRTTAVGFQFAELDTFRALERLLERAGRESVRSVRVIWRTLSYAQRTRTWGWKTDRAQHGGVMNLLGSHVFHLLECLLGPVAEIRAKFSDAATRAFAPTGTQPAEDTAVLEGVTAAGAQFGIALANAATDAHAHRWELELRDGRLILETPPGDPHGPLSLVREAPAGREVLAVDAPAAGADARLEPFRRLAERFVHAARARAPCSPDFGAGARVQRLLEIAATSAASAGARVRVGPPR